MEEFTVVELEDINNPNYEYFIVLKNGNNLYEEFVDSITQKKDKEGLYKISSTMDFYGLPNINFTDEKFRHIEGNKNDRDDVFEFKGNNIRIYAIKTENRFFILMGGFKKNQKKDIKKVFNLFNNFNINLFI